MASFTARIVLLTRADSVPLTDHAASLRAYQVVMLVTPVVAIVLRFWSRALAPSSKAPRIWWDDWLALAALVKGNRFFWIDFMTYIWQPLSIVSNSLEIYLISLGFGKHIKTIPFEDLKQLLKVLWIDYFMGDACLTLTKASALLFYQRVFTTNSVSFRYALWIAYALVFLWWISAIARCLLLCTPPQKYFKPEVSGHCRSSDALFIGSAVPSVTIDIYILLLPMPTLWQLHLSLARKILISAALISGYL